MFQSQEERSLEIFERAKVIHSQERRITLESVKIVAELEAESAWHYLGMSVEQMAFSIGLTPSQYYKRLKASKVMTRYPLTQEIFEKGETQISHIAMIAPHLTDANSEVLIEGIRNKTKREVEALMLRVDCSGQIIDLDPRVEITIGMTESQRSLFERVREVLAQKGQPSTTLSALLHGSEAFLEKNDPMQIAERAAERREKRERRKKERAEIETEAKVEAEAEAEAAPYSYADNVFEIDITDEEDDWEGAPPIANEADETYSDEELRTLTPLERIKARYKKKRRDPRTPIKASVRNRVWLRDGGQCTHVHGNGQRCIQKSMLELDHVKMVCHGGTNEEENLTLKCRRHNQFAAELALGKEFMAKKRAAAR